MVTPQIETPEIAKAIGVDRLFLKREDLHPYGSHKGRSIPTMIDLKIADSSAKDFVISSSGNASLAALRHIQKLNTAGANLTLEILVGKNMNTEKRHVLVAEIKDKRITIEEVADPLRTIFQMTRDGGKTSLRQSTDDSALVGYESLASEIAETPGLAVVFVGTSSGTTPQALANYFIAHKKPVAVHIVQTENTSPLAREFDTAAESTTVPSIADAIIDKVAHRRDPLIAAIKTTGGSGWVATNEDIRKAQKLLRDNANIDTTGNGALGLAGLIHARQTGAKFAGSIVAIITGK